MTQQMHEKVKQEPQTSKELEIMLRRQKVWSLHKQGFNQIEIAEKLGVSSKTISRDFQDLKSEAIEWMNALPEGEVQLHHKKSIEGVEQVIQELWKSYRNTKNEGMKLRILALIADKTKMHSEMISQKNVLGIRQHTQHQLRYKEAYGKYPNQRFMSDPIPKKDNSQEQNVQ